MDRDDVDASIALRLTEVTAKVVSGLNIAQFVDDPTSEAHLTEAVRDLSTMWPEDNQLRPVPVEKLLAQSRYLIEMMLEKIEKGEVADVPNVPGFTSAYGDLRQQVMGLSQEWSARRLGQLGERVEGIFEQASEDAERAKEAADQAQVAAGTAGESTLAAFFDLHAREQRASANSLRLIVGVMVVLVVGLGAVVVFVYQHKETSTQQTLSRLALALPLFGLAVYLSREASRHREAGDAAKEIAVRLQTFQPFSATLTTDEQVKIRAALGGWVFAQPRAAKANQYPNPFSRKRIEALAQLSEALRATNGGK
jgi:hypothetical protein